MPSSVRNAALLAGLAAVDAASVATRSTARALSTVSRAIAASRFDGIRRREVRHERVNLSGGRGLDGHWRNQELRISVVRRRAWVRQPTR